jgi:ankyrin repeat protein
MDFNKLFEFIDDSNICIFQSFEEIIKKNINSSNKEGHTLFSKAVMKDQIGCAKFFLKCGADINLLYRGCSPLEMVNNIKMLELLVTNGIDINARSKKGTSMIIKIISEWDNKYDGCKLLLEKGAKLNYTDDGGNSALHMAFCKNEYTLCELLLSYGADVHCRNNSGNTPLLCYIIEYNRGNISFSINMIDLLLKHDSNVNIINRNDESIIKCAASLKLYNLLKLLIEKRVEIPDNIKEEFKKDPCFAELFNCAVNKDQEIDDLKNKVKELETDAILTQHIRETRQEYVEKLQKTFDESSEKNEKLQKIIDELSEKNEKLIADNEESTIIAKDIKIRKEEEIEKLQKIIDELSEKNEKLIADNKKLKKDYDKIKDIVE